MRNTDKKHTQRKYFTSINIKEKRSTPQEKQEYLLYKASLQYEYAKDTNNQENYDWSLKHINEAIKANSTPNENLISCYRVRSNIYMSLGSKQKSKLDTQKAESLEKQLKSQPPFSNQWQQRVEQQEQFELSM